MGRTSTHTYATAVVNPDVLINIGTSANCWPFFFFFFFSSFLFFFLLLLLLVLLWVLLLLVFGVDRFLATSAGVCATVGGGSHSTGKGLHSLSATVLRTLRTPRLGPVTVPHLH